MEKSWKKAIKRVLEEGGAPMHYGEISDRILSRGYYETYSETPAATVNAQLATSIRNDGNKSPFLRVGRGVFALNNSPVKTVALALVPTPRQIKFQPPAEMEEDSSGSIIKSFGMYWQRDLVIWENGPKLYGKHQALSKPVDFGAQSGIYILYDHQTVVHIGSSIDCQMGKRLYEHTHDRLGSRWNRFSWFGLHDVTHEGNLREIDLLGEITISIDTFYATLEAMIIAVRGPALNRKRCNDFPGVEYIQDTATE